LKPERLRVRGVAHHPEPPDSQSSSVTSDDHLRRRATEPFGWFTSPALSQKIAAFVTTIGPGAY
jgi:hypothetical protein